jgi:hypothetical protein
LKSEITVLSSYVKIELSRLWCTTVCLISVAFFLDTLYNLILLHSLV